MFVHIDFSLLKLLEERWKLLILIYLAFFLILDYIQFRWLFLVEKRLLLWLAESSRHFTDIIIEFLDFDFFSDLIEFAIQSLRESLS